MRKIFLLLTIALVAFNFSPVFAGSGGPDTYGYTWIDSDEASGPTFTWVDITAAGTEIVGLGDDNAAASPIDIGFDFPYYWDNYDQIKLGSNGWLSFNTGVGNIAHCFPTMPAIGGNGDNLVCPFLTDLNFSGATNPGQVFYWTNNVDTLIISYINVAWWRAAAPEFVGSNTFQVIFDGATGIIRFQYQTMSPSDFNNTAGCDADCVIGIENVTGNIGIQHSQEVIPADNYAVTFVPPVTPLISIPDAQPDWLANTENAGQFYFTGNDVNLISKIKNVGNGDLTTATTAAAEVRNLALTSVYTGTETTAALAAGENEIVTFSPAWTIATAGQYYFEVETSSADDINPSNNVSTIEISAVDVDTVGCIATLTYSTGNAPDGVVAWSGGAGEDGAGIKIVPPGYPVTISSIEAFILSGTVDPINSGSFSLRLYDDDGPGGSAGTEIANIPVAKGDYTADAWVSVDVSPAYLLTSGAVYAAWFMGTDSAVALGTETLGPISRRTYEILSSSWATYRQSTVEDFLIRVNIDPCSVGNDKDVNPSEMALEISAFPNPASVLSTVRYNLPVSGTANFSILNMMGQVVHKKVYGPLPAGIQEFNFDTTPLSAGTYFINITTDGGLSGNMKFEVVR